jgi:hypothetical protein
MLQFLQGRISVRKARLFAIACCRRIWHILTNQEGRDALAVAGQFAEGELTFEQVCELHDHLWHISFSAIDGFRREKENNLICTSVGAVSETLQEERFFLDTSWVTGYRRGGSIKAPFSAALAVAHWHRKDDADGIHWDAFKEEYREQAGVLREIVGNPFRAISLDPAWLAWNDHGIVKLAEAIYQERAFPTGFLDNARLAILADALEEAGCANPDILKHCREQGGVHVRGCWVIDLLLGKE